jgi:hypothetical protein
MKKWRCEYEIDEELMRITVFFRNASARCCAPTAPISFFQRFSVVSVCVKSRDVHSGAAAAAAAVAVAARQRQLF